jgi:hypothetical protein
MLNKDYDNSGQLSAGMSRLALKKSFLNFASLPIKIKRGFSFQQ